MVIPGEKAVGAKYKDAVSVSDQDMNERCCPFTSLLRLLPVWRDLTTHPGEALIGLWLSQSPGGMSTVAGQGGQNTELSPGYQEQCFSEYQELLPYPNSQECPEPGTPDREKARERILFHSKEFYHDFSGWYESKLLLTCSDLFSGDLGGLCTHLHNPEPGSFQGTAEDDCSIPGPGRRHLLSR